jgi:hypothetical protein
MKLFMRIATLILLVGSQSLLAQEDIDRNLEQGEVIVKPAEQGQAKCRQSRNREGAFSRSKNEDTTVCRKAQSKGMQTLRFELREACVDRTSEECQEVREQVQILRLQLRTCIRQQAMLRQEKSDIVSQDTEQVANFSHGRRPASNDSGQFLPVTDEDVAKPCAN